LKYLDAELKFRRKNTFQLLRYLINDHESRKWGLEYQVFKKVIEIAEFRLSRILFAFGLGGGLRFESI
jgi:hypothetical protein